MESKKSIEVQNVLLLNRNRRPHRVVVLLLVRHYDVQPIDCPTLKQNHELLLARSSRGYLCQNTPRQKRWNRRGPHQCQRSTLHEATPAHHSLRRVATVNVASPVTAVGHTLPRRHVLAPVPASGRGHGFLRVSSKNTP